MSLLDEARSIINDVDEKMAKLFCERMRAAEMVAEYKKQHGLKIYDAEREEARHEQKRTGNHAGKVS